MNRHLTLYELNGMVRQAIDRMLPDAYWVEAELSEVRESRGHCYIELVQKDPAGNTPVARASAKCWRQTWAVAQPYFERITGQTLHPGMKVLLKVYAQFHEAFGFSWIITDIDPQYTLGDMARKRQEIIRQLKAEGVFDLNRELALPLFAQRIAVISSATAAGYGDFCNQLADNAYGFSFTTRLFAAQMQGEQVENSIVTALNTIFRHWEDYDCVVIIRGGGATSDMSGFDSLMLAENVANFPLPVITGIGHDRDECILDMVAHTRVKTPTAAAAFLIAHLQQVAERIAAAEQKIVNTVRARMEREQLRLESLSSHLPVLFTVVKTRQEARIGRAEERMTAAVARQLTDERHRLDQQAAAIRPILERILTAERHRLEMLQQRTQTLDPQRLLQRGYSITLKDGRAVRDPQALKPGDSIETRVEKGIIQSIIQ